MYHFLALLDLSTACGTLVCIPNPSNLWHFAILFLILLDELGLIPMMYPPLAPFWSEVEIFHSMCEPLMGWPYLF